MTARPALRVLNVLGAILAIALILFSAIGAVTVVPLAAMVGPAPLTIALVFGAMLFGIYHLDDERRRWRGRNLSIVVAFVLFAAITMLFGFPTRHGAKGIATAALIAFIPTYGMAGLTRLLRWSSRWLGEDVRRTMAIVGAFVLALGFIYYLVMLPCEILHECL